MGFHYVSRLIFIPHFLFVMVEVRRFEICLKIDKKSAHKMVFICDVLTFF